jgi:hypothetical protein
MVARRVGTGAGGGTRPRHLYRVLVIELIVIAMPCVRSKRRPDCSDEMRPLLAPPSAVVSRHGLFPSLSRSTSVPCLPLVLV